MSEPQDKPKPVDVEVIGGVAIPVYRNLQEGLQAAGIQPGETVELVAPPQMGNTICVRCLLPTDEDRYGVCFACAMLECPDNEDWEIERGLAALKDGGHTFDRWLQGRRLFGKLVPEGAHLERLQAKVSAP